MPHSSRAKKKLWSKRQEILDPNGWTHVVKTAPKNISQDLKLGLSLLRNKPDIDGATCSPTEVPDGLTVEMAREKYASYLARWNNTRYCQDLQRDFKNIILPVNHLEITQCICLGLGSFFAKSHFFSLFEGAAVRESFSQLLALVTMLDVLKEKHDIKDVFFQEPRFNSLDKELLLSMGFVVLESPDAMERMTSTTFLFTPHLEFFIIQNALEKAHPSLYCGNDLEHHVQWLDGINETFPGFLKNRCSVSFPQVKSDHVVENALSNLTITWKPDKEDPRLSDK